jgi:APA family basic amino acid/polyamine antiporter
MYGWMALLVMDPGLTAALAVGLASYVGYNIHLSSAGVKLVAISTILLVAAANVRGVRIGARLVRWLTFLKLALLGFLLLWGFGFQLGDWSNFEPLIAQRANSSPLIPALAGGLLGAFFSFGGWWDVSKVAGEVRNPAYTLPRALAYGVVIVTLVYILTSAVFMYLVPLDRVTSGETFAAQAGEVLFGQVGARIFSFVVIVAALGSLAAVIMSAPRVYFAMARDGLFIPALAVIHPRYETPARATALQAILASLLVLLADFSRIVSYFVFVVVIFIGLTVASLFVFRRRRNRFPAYVTAGYPVTPIVFLILIILLLVLLGANNLEQSLKGLGVVLLGLPVYYFLYGRQSGSRP